MSTDDLEIPVTAAYESHGIELVTPTAGEAPDRMVMLRPGLGWVSLFDESDGASEIATLAQIAVAVTRATDSVALLTSMWDSDSFQIVLFARGEQVDIVATEPTDERARLTQLSAGARTRVWGALFPTATQEMLAAANGLDTPYIEQQLAAWCATAGLDPARTTETLAQVASIPEVTIRSAIPATATRGQDISPRLSFFSSPGDTPHLRVFPAAWPVPVGESRSFKWLVVSADGGFDGLECTLETEPPDEVDFGEISLTAFPFYNGQITSMTPLASHRTPLNSQSSQTVRAEPFSVPDVDPSGRKQIVIVIHLDATVAGDRPVTIRFDVKPDGSRSRLSLPPLRLQARRPAWRPRGSETTGNDSLASSRNEAVLGLDEPAIRSFVAIHRDLGQPFRDQVRNWCESWLDGLTSTDDTLVVAHTQKHMTASFRVSKNTRNVAANTLTGNKLWPRLFRADDGYQTVRLTVHSPGYAHPIAGVTIQESLRNDPLATQSLVDALSDLLGIGMATRPEEIGQPTLAVAAWVIDHSDIDQLLGTSSAAMLRSATAWCETTGPVQAWSTSTCWIPEFDLYDEYRETLYEEASALDWFRSGVRGGLGTAGWTTRRLRFVAPRMWLGTELADRIDLGAVERVATVHRSARTVALSLRREYDLGDLEHVLGPILPNG